MKSLFSTLFALLIVGSISAQNVGINTSTPEATLDVNGTAKVSSLASGATEMVVSDANGNLSTQPIPVMGIPTEISDADGDTKVQVEGTPNDNIIRFEAGGSQVMTLFQNASGIPTVSVGNVGGNLSVGSGAGGILTSGINNTHLGQRAGAGSTIGFLNTFVGFEAGFSTDSAGDNTFIGAFSGKNNERGGENVFVGSFTGFSNTTGFNNTFLGRYSGEFNTTGNNNTYVGYSAGLNNVAGTGNVFLGRSAGADELGSNRLYIENSASASPLIYGEFDNNFLEVNGSFEINQDPNDNMIMLNRNNWSHGSGNQVFGDGGDHFIIASQEGSFETAGMYGDGDHLTFWSPGDGAPGQPGALAYFLDEDNMDSGDNDPFNNNAVEVYLNNTGVWQVSDSRKKANIEPMTNALEKVQSLSGYTYEFLPNEKEIAKGDQPTPAAGVMAQELKAVLPQAVNETQNGDHFVNYSAIVPLLIEAIKTQQSQIEQLESQIEALQAE